MRCRKATGVRYEFLDLRDNIFLAGVHHKISSESLGFCQTYVVHIQGNQALVWFS